MIFAWTLNLHYKAYELNPFTPDLREWIIETLQILGRRGELEIFLKNDSHK